MAVAISLVRPMKFWGVTGRPTVKGFWVIGEREKLGVIDCTSTLTFTRRFYGERGDLVKDVVKHRWLDGKIYVSLGLA
jgi:hypothetical protein